MGRTPLLAISSYRYDRETSGNPFVTILLPTALLLLAYDIVPSPTYSDYR